MTENLTQDQSNRESVQDNVATSWAEMLSPELREDPLAQRFKSADDVFKSLKEANSKLGSTIPRPPAGREDYRKWKQERTPILKEDTEVEFSKPETDYPGVEKDLEKFKQIAIKNNLTAEEAADLWEDYINVNIEGFNEYKEMQNSLMDKDREALKEAWGNDYDRKFERAVGIAKKFGEGTDILEAVTEGKASKEILMLLNNVADSMSEDRVPASSVPKAKDASAAQAALESFRMEHGTALTNRNAPNHNALKAKYNKLLEEAFG